MCRLRGRGKRNPPPQEETGALYKRKALPHTRQGFKKGDELYELYYSRKKERYQREMGGKKWKR